MKLGLDAPAYVLESAQDFVQGQFDALAADSYGWDGSGNYNEENAGPGNVVWDDWRINDLRGPYYETAGGCSGGNLENRLRDPYYHAGPGHAGRRFLPG